MNQKNNLRNQINSNSKVTLLKLLKPHHSVLTTGITTLFNFLISVIFFFLFSFTLFSQDQTFTVTVSGGKYFINGQEAPVLQIEKGKTYRFDTSDSSLGVSTGHPLRFGTLPDDGTQYSLFQEYGTLGSSGSYVDLTVPTDSSLTSLYYYCLYHDNMGNAFNFFEPSSIEVTSYSNTCLLYTSPSPRDS